jgi:DNA-directed RNA polymerase specialized sigma24 family protein
MVIPPLNTKPIRTMSVSKNRCRGTHLSRFKRPSEARTHVVSPIDWPIFMHQQYATACGVIRRLTPCRLHASYDPEDFVDDAIVDLLSKSPRFVEFTSSLVILIAKRRMIDAARSPRSRLMNLAVDLIDDCSSVALESEPAELREWMLDRAGDSDDRAVFDLRSQGHTLPEIANRTGRGLRTLQRFFKDFTEANEPH